MKNETYVVCQTAKCQQTYNINSFKDITSETKNIKCKKCDGVLIDEHGYGNLSQNPQVIPVISKEDMMRMEQRGDYIEL